MAARDVLVVGAGVFGAAVACELARHGWGPRVRVLERLQLAAGATCRAAALVTAVRDDPGQIVLARQTLATIATLQAEGEALGWHASGALHVAPAALRPLLEARAAIAAANGMRSRWLSHDAARALAPWLDAPAFEHALYFPDDGWLDPHLLASAYLRVAVRHGVRVETAEVRRLVVDGGAVRGVETADGLVAASTVVLATGAWANVLSAPAGLPLPLAPVRSQYWISTAAPCFPREGAIVLMPAIRAYARPELGGLLFGVREPRPAVVDARRLPADLGGFAFEPEDADGWQTLAAAAEDLGRHLPVLPTLGIAHAVSGPSAYTPDGQLVVGTAPGLAGLVVAAGCNGSGISFSGGVGRLVGELVRGAAPFVDLVPAAPGRLGDFDPHAPDFLAACAAARSRKTSG